MAEKKITTKDLEKIHIMRTLKHMEYREIAKQFGVSHTAIWRRYKKWLNERINVYETGVPVTRKEDIPDTFFQKNKKITNKDLEKIHMMRVRYPVLSYRKIAKQFGVHNTTIRIRYLKWLKHPTIHVPISGGTTDTTTTNEIEMDWKRPSIWQRIIDFIFRRG